jgi:predicted nucleotide-binding protein
MQKSYQYSGLRFSVDVLREAFQAAVDASKERRENKESTSGTFQPTFSVEAPDGTGFKYDTLDEFLAAYSHSDGDFALALYGNSYKLVIRSADAATSVTVEASQGFISFIFDIFERGRTTAKKVVSKWALPKVPDKPTKTVKTEPVIFIGHGAKLDWIELRDHLLNMHKLDVLTFESDSHAGYSNPDVVEAYVKRATFGLLVFSGEDRQESGKLRARQNVVHELGLLTNRLGRRRAIILFEDGTEEFTNISGVHQIRFAPGHIQSTFGHVLAVLKREFPP